MFWLRLLIAFTVTLTAPERTAVRRPRLHNFRSVPSTVPCQYKGLTLPGGFLGYPGITQHNCEDRQCCWQSDELGSTLTPDQPQCFHSDNGPSEYELITTTATGMCEAVCVLLCSLAAVQLAVVRQWLLSKQIHCVIVSNTDVGWKGVLRNLTSTQPDLGPDITTLQVTADTRHDDILHISITDLHDTRWRIPAHFYPELSYGESTYHLTASIHTLLHKSGAHMTFAPPLLSCILHKVNMQLFMSTLCRRCQASE